MLTLYLTGLLIGGVLVGLSAFAGGDVDLDMDVDVDVDADIDADADVDADADADGTLPDLAITWLPFASLRFWTFFLLAGGLMGTLLTFVGSASVVSTSVMSLAMGYVSGLVTTRVISQLKREKVTSSVGEADFIGASARVLLPLTRNTIGQVRVRVKGRDVDVMARSVDRDLAIEEAVLVCDVRDGVALVAPVEV